MREYPAFSATSSGSMTLTIFGLLRIRLGVDDVNARRAQARHDEVAPLHMRVGRVGAKAGRARVPAEMVQLVAGIRHVDLADDLRVGARAGIDVDDGYRVGLLPVGVERRHIGQFLRRRFRGHSR